MVGVNYWDPLGNLSSNSPQSNYGIIILNTQIKLNPSLLINLWKLAKVTVTVDGGTNQWFDWLCSNNVDPLTVSSPNIICGDMDSISTSILETFKTNSNTKVIKTLNQDETDFTKSLREIKKHNLEHNINIDTIYAIADSCGRFDHIMANINTLFKVGTIAPNFKVFLLAKTSCTWLLEAGAHKICIPEKLRTSNTWCGLIPIGNDCCLVTTSGLKWNLSNEELAFGKMVSTSNTYDGSPNVTIETNHPLIWTMGINPFLR